MLITIDRHPNGGPIGDRGSSGKGAFAVPMCLQIFGHPHRVVQLGRAEKVPVGPQAGSSAAASTGLAFWLPSCRLAKLESEDVGDASIEGRSEQRWQSIL